MSNLLTIITSNASWEQAFKFFSSLTKKEAIIRLNKVRRGESQDVVNEEPN